MKTAVILHGMPSEEEYFSTDVPSPSNFHWLTWLQKQLILNGILAQTPEMPEPYAPEYKRWCSIFERQHVDRDTILVGHSGGAGFLLRWLSENKVEVGKLALIAPFLDPDKTKGDFFVFPMDEFIVFRTNGVCVFFSSDDKQHILTSAELIKFNVKNIKVMQFAN